MDRIVDCWPVPFTNLELLGREFRSNCKAVEPFELGLLATDCEDGAGPVVSLWLDLKDWFRDGKDRVLSDFLPFSDREILDPVDDFEIEVAELDFLGPKIGQGLDLRED